MKKETKVFLIILFGWLALLDFAILKTVISKYVSNFNSLIVKNLINGATVYYSMDKSSILSVLIIPLFIFNLLIIIFLSLSYYFFLRSKNAKSNLERYRVSKKAQAATEFIMTYGWAIMAFIVSIAALSYFGAIPLGSPTGKSICALSPGFNCKEFIIGTDGVTLVIENGLGVNLLDVTVNITNSAQGPCVESSPPKKLNIGQSDSFFVFCYNIQGPDTTFKGDIVIKYRKEGFIISSTSAGVVSGKVQPTKSTPTIILTEPQQGQQYTGLLFDLVYEVDDDNLDSCWYVLDQGPDRSLQGCESKYHINSLTSGLHTLVLLANNSKGNTGSRSVDFTTGTAADTEAPIPSNSSMSPNPAFQYDLVEFNTTWTDNIQLAEYTFSIDNGTGLFVNYSLTFSGTSNLSRVIRNTTELPETTIRWRFFAKDTSNNMGASEIGTFTVASGLGDGGCADCVEFCDELVVDGRMIFLCH